MNSHHAIGLLLVLVLISLGLNEFLPRGHSTIYVSGAVTSNELESYSLGSRNYRHLVGESFTSESERTRHAIQELQSEIMELLQAQRTDENDDISVKEARQVLVDERMGQERELVQFMQKNRWSLTRDMTNFEHRHYLLMIDSSKEEWQLEGMKGLKQLFPKSPQFTQQLTSEEKKIESVKEQFPTQLDPVLLDVSRSEFAILNNSLTRSGLSWWSQQPDLDRDKVARIVGQLTQPLSAEEMKLVIRDLSEPILDEKGRGPYERTKFFSQPIHKELTLEQLDEIKFALPNLWIGSFEVKERRTDKWVTQYDSTFLEHWIRQHLLNSSCDEWWDESGPGSSDLAPMVRQDFTAAAEFLEKLWSISETLLPQFNHLRAILQFHVLWYQFRFFHQFNDERYRAFLSLPRFNGGNSNIFNEGDPLDDTIKTSFSPYIKEIRSSLRLQEYRFNIYDMSRLICQNRPFIPSIFRKLTWENDGFLLTQYLRHYYSQVEHDELGLEWNGLVRLSLLNVTMVQTRLETLDLDSATVQKYQSLLGSVESARLRDSVQIEFNNAVDVEQNKLRFQSNESVVVHFKVKNVPIVHVRIYVINTRNYYTSKQKELDGANFNLDGVSPNYESTLNFTDSNVSPYRIVSHSLELTQLSNYSRGVFIIELFGSGHRTRALLRKGGLTAVYQVTPIGYQFQIIDIDTKTAVPGHILVGTQSYDSEPNAGSTIMLPFLSDMSQQTMFQHIILLSSVDSFADLFPVLLHREQYAFAASMYVDRESLLSHNTAHVLISSHLLLRNPSNEGGREAWIELDMNRLSNILLQITTTDMAGIESTQMHQNLNLTNLEETVVPFLVPDQLSEIVFQLTADITHQATGQKTTLLARRYWVKVNSIQQTTGREGVYLRWNGVKEGYSLSILGRTGEPMPHRPIRLSVYHKYFTQSPYPISLQTNEKGEIHLGPLVDIREIAVQKVLSPLELSSPDIHTRNLLIRIPIPATNDYSDGLSTYPRIISEVEGKDIQIPIFDPSFHFSPKTVTLYRAFGERVTFHDRTLANHHHVTFHSTNTERQLRIHHLPSGHYTLWLQTSSASAYESVLRYELHIHAGVEVMPGYIYRNDSIPTNGLEIAEITASQQQKLQVVSVDAKVAPAISPSLMTKTAVKIQLAGVDHTTRVHLIASHFVPSHHFGSNPWLSTMKPRRIQSSYPQSKYFTQVRLGDEHRYILERQVQGSRIGNMLPHPSLILFQHMTQATTVLEPPTLHGGEEFRDGSQGSGQYTSGFGEFPNEFTFTSSAMTSSATEVGVANTFEFLRVPSTYLTNLRPNETTSLLEISLNHSIDQRYLQIIVVNSGGMIIQQRIQLPLPESESKQVGPQYRDLRLLSPLNASQHFMESHLITPLSHKNDSLIITNHQTSTIETYGSLSDVWQLFRAIMKSSPTNSSLAGFDFLLHWNHLSQAAKLKHYNEYGCHELNIFIWLKDQPFFHDTIRPLLTQKYHLTFVDQVLLNETDLRSFTRPNLFMKLNTVEKILLGLHLASHHPSLALIILDHLIGSSSVVNLSRKSDLENYIRLFKVATQSRGLDMDAFTTAFYREPGDDLDFRRGGLLQRQGWMEEAEDAMRTIEDEIRSGGSRFTGPEIYARNTAAASDHMHTHQYAGAQQKRAGQTGGPTVPTNNAPRRPTVPTNNAPRRTYVELPTTKEYEERGYYMNTNNPNDQPNIPNHAFWSEIVEGLKKRIEVGQPSLPILSQHIALPTNSFTEMVAALAFLDLPFESQEERPITRPTEDGHGLIITAQTPVIVFHKEMREIVANTEEASIVSGPNEMSVSTNYFDPADRYLPVDESDDGGQAEKYITGAFQTQRVYYAQVVITNASSKRRRLTILTQIPEGSIAIAIPKAAVFGFNSMVQATKSEFVLLEPFATQVLYYAFYFPSAGSFQHFPTQVTSGHQVIGQSKVRVLEVLDVLPPVPQDRTVQVRDWRWLSQSGTEAEILEYLRRENLHRIDLSLICWRFTQAKPTESSFWLEVIQILKDQLIYSSSIYSFTFKFIQNPNLGSLEDDFIHVGRKKYLDPHATRSSQSQPHVYHLGVQHAILSDYVSTEMPPYLGPFFSSSLVTRDWLEDGQIQHLEYSPLIIARTHQLRTKSGTSDLISIQNQQLHRQYERFLTYLTFRHSGSEFFTKQEMLAITYYLVLQDRIPETQQWFNRVDELDEHERSEAKDAEPNVKQSVEEAKSTAIAQQRRGMLEEHLLDYFRCYFDFFNARPTRALTIAQRYRNHPLHQPRQLFKEILLQLDEIGLKVDEGNCTDQTTASDEPTNRGDLTSNTLLRSRTMTDLGSLEPTLDFRFVTPTAIELLSRQISAVRINFYRIEIELMFSAAPFQMHQQTATGSSSTSANLPPSLLFIAPTHTMVVRNIPTAADGKLQYLIELPLEQMQRNCWIEITTADIVNNSTNESDESSTASNSTPRLSTGSHLSVVRPHFSPHLSVEMMSSYGQLRVRTVSTDQLLPRTYVKVYARMKDGAVEFYKDGYTDHRQTKTTTIRMKNGCCVEGHF